MGDWHLSQQRGVWTAVASVFSLVTIGQTLVLSVGCTSGIFSDFPKQSHDPAPGTCLIAGIPVDCSCGVGDGYSFPCVGSVLWRYSCDGKLPDGNLKETLNETFNDYACCGDGAPEGFVTVDCEKQCLIHECNQLKEQHIAEAQPLGGCDTLGPDCGFDQAGCETGILTMHVLPGSCPAGGSPSCPAGQICCPDPTCGPTDDCCYFIQVVCNLEDDIDRDSDGFPVFTETGKRVCSAGTMSLRPNNEVEESPGDSLVQVCLSGPDIDTACDTSGALLGAARYSLVECSGGGDCIHLEEFEARISANVVISVGDEETTLSGMKLFSRRPIEVPVGADGDFAIPSGMLEVLFTYFQDGVLGVVREGNQLTIQGTVNRATDVFNMLDIVMQRTSAGGEATVTVEVDFVGRHVNRGPNASFLLTTPPECGTDLVFDSLGTSDLDADPLLGTWFIPNRVRAAGSVLTTRLPVGNFLVQFNSADPEGGFGMALRRFDIFDTLDPGILHVPADETVECDAVPEPAQPVATDICDPDPTLGFDETRINGDCPANYTLIRTWTATDASGNTGTGEQTITVQDTTPPQITCPENVAVRCTTPNGRLVSDVPLEATASDNCDPIPSLMDDKPDLHYPPTCGIRPPTVVTFTATDDCGNESTCEAEVEVFGEMCCPGFSDTELALLPAWVDLRQDNEGPTVTKAKFDIWNQNEVRFSGTERCVNCWDQSLVSLYGAPNHFLLRNLHTDKGRARIDGLASANVCDTEEIASVNAPLLGVLIKEINFAVPPRQRPQQERTAITPPGTDSQTGRIQFDVSGGLLLPDDPEVGELGEATEEWVAQGFSPGGLEFPTAKAMGHPPTEATEPQRHEATKGRDGSVSTFGLFDVSTFAIDNDDPPVEPAGLTLDTRASTSDKGSILVFPSIEVKWDILGNVVQDTFIELTNDYAQEVRVQAYFVQGDPPAGPVFAGDPPVRLEREHDGWNNVDAQFRLTPNQPTYWSVLTGQPRGVQPWTILDPGFPPGRPDVNPRNRGGRMLRGFIILWAVNATGQEINWNHLTGSATIVHYGNSSAWDYKPWAFQCLSTGAVGTVCDGVPGQLNLDGIEYAAAPEKLLIDFYATGSTALSHPDVRFRD